MLIHGLNLFPLTKTHVRAVGYYMDQDGEIWSTRARAGRITKLKGSRTSSGRYITLQTNGSFGQIHRLSDLQHAARAHCDFTTETTVGARQKKIPIEIKVIPVRPAGLSLLTAKIRRILANINWNKNPK